MPASPPAEPAETVFLRYAREGDAQALERLLASVADRCFTQARRIVGDPHLAEEAVQEAWLRLIQTAARYDGSVPFAAWLGRLVCAAAIDQARAARRRGRREDPMPVQIIARPLAAPAEHAALREALAELPERYREPLVLHYFGGLTQQETAQALGVAPGTVAAQLSRGRERLRGRLERSGAAFSAVALVDLLSAQPSWTAPATLVHASGALAAGKGAAGALAAGKGAASGLAVGKGAAVASAAAGGAPTALIATGIGLALAAVAAAAIAVASPGRGPAQAGAPVGTSATSAATASTTAARAATAADAPLEVVLQPGDDLQAAVDAHPPGTHFRLRPGVYREAHAEPKDDDAFLGDAGATLDGARVLTGFTRRGERWVVGGQHQHGQEHGEAQPEHLGARYAEELFIDRAPLEHLADPALLRPGAWWFDYAAGEIVLADDPTGHAIETSVTRAALAGPASRVRIADLTVRHYATPAQMGAIGDQYCGAGWTIERCDVGWNHGTGINVRDGARVAGCRIHDNGQKGLGGGGADVVVEDCVIAGNNRAGFSGSWEGGGAKFGHARGLLLRRNQVLANHGCGLLVESGMVDALIQGNEVRDNELDGIGHKQGRGARILGNVVVGNGRLDNAWGYGAQILLRDSRDCEVAGNRVEARAAGADGIMLMQQAQADGEPTLGNRVHGNVIALLGPDSCSGACSDGRFPEMYGSNRFDGDTYVVPDPSGARWGWRDRALTWAEFCADGNEAGGRLVVGTSLAAAP